MAEEDIRYSDGPIIGLPLLEAAGGLVINNGRLLCIKKHGLWDLPKGKLDPGESLEACARRADDGDRVARAAKRARLLPDAPVDGHGKVFNQDANGG